MTRPRCGASGMRDAGDCRSSMRGRTVFGGTMVHSIFCFHYNKEMVVKEKDATGATHQDDIVRTANVIGWAAPIGNLGN